MNELAPVPAKEDTLKLARRVVWYEDPADVLRDPIHLILHVMEYGTFDDLNVLVRYVGNDGLRLALAQARPGILSPRSWAYWTSVLEVDLALPQRQFPTG